MSKILERFEEETGHWEIWIDDVDGELAMRKEQHRARRKIEVVEKEVFDRLCTQLRKQLMANQKLKEVLKWYADADFRGDIWIDGKRKTDEFQINDHAIRALADLAKIEGGA